MKARLKLSLFCSICYNKIFSGKELLLEKCKKNQALFRTRFSSPTALRRFYIQKHLKPQVLQFQSFIYHPWKFQMSLFTRLGETIWTKWPIKNHKIFDISKPEVTSSTHKKSISRFLSKGIMYENFKKSIERFQEILCTKR